MQEFREFLINNGLIPREIPVGIIARCPTIDKPRKKNGAFYFTGYSGWCKNFGTGLTVGWKSQIKTDPVKMAEIEREHRSTQRQQILDTERKQINAEKKAAEMIEQSEQGTSMYFTIKGFDGHICPIYRESDIDYILVPMYYKGKIAGIQKISPEGSKKFLYGQRTNDCYFPIGSGGRTFLCEGYLTGLTAHLLLNKLSIKHNVIVCFSADNMLRLSRGFKDGFVIADNDKSKTGERVAKESGLPYYLPENVGNDLNDEYVTKGIFSTMMRLRSFL